MPKQNAQILAFNRGIISPLALARLDVDRIPWSAVTQTNWMPRLLGSMMLRAGLKYTQGTYNNNQAVHIDFIFAKDDTAIIEFTNAAIRVKVDDAAITRGSVSSAVTNGTFNSDLSSWTDNDEAGAASTWATGGYMQLLGDGTNAARRTQQVTVAGGDQNYEHALRIIIQRGPVTLKVGSTSGADDYIAETDLETGTHSLAFTPTGDFYIDFSSRLDRIILVDSVAVEASGAMVLTSPYLTADLGFIRWAQSADVIYLACIGYQQRKIERRGTRSWSIVLYQPEDGPVKTQNVTNISITPSGLTGNISLTASKALFKSTQIGGLFKIISTGQNVSASISAQNTFTSTIEVTGASGSRDFTITITGLTATGSTVTLQRSVDDGVSYSDVTTYTANYGPTVYNDGLTNQTILYRIGVKTGGYVAGTIAVSLSYSLGSITGYARITAYTSTTVVSAEVLNALGNTTATTSWAEGEWSDYRGWPSAVALTEGRIWFSGKSKNIGGISDAYESFSDEIEGDSGLISRSIGSGPVDNVNWLLPLYRLFIGTDTAEKGIKTTSFEEPITPTNFKIVDASTQGSANVNPAKLDKKGIFVQSGGTRIFELTYDGQSLDYASEELTKLCPEIGEPSITRVCVQRQPDTRIHCVRSDGLVAVLVYDPVENLKGWVLVETDGDVEDVIVMPGDVEDSVYYCIKRTINGSTVRYLEKWALESECQGGTLNNQADSFIAFTNGPASATVTGLSHLEAESVVVWADGKCLTDSSGNIATFTVASGSITLTNAGSSYSATTGIVGLPYTAQYKSTKLAYAAGLGTALNQPKRVNYLGVVMNNAHYQGLKFGSDFNNLSNLPLVENGTTTPVDTIWSEYDKDQFEFDGTWNTDSRLCLQASAPRPCTLLAAVLGMVTNDKG